MATKIGVVVILAFLAGEVFVVGKGIMLAYRNFPSVVGIPVSLFTTIFMILVVMAVIGVCRDALKKKGGLHE